MKIVVGNPPNIEEIIKHFPDRPTNTVYCYGDTLYNPDGNQVPEDVVYHEYIHSKQQTDPEVWWKRYLIDPEFRKNQEVEAYSAQYEYIKKHVGKKVSDIMLNDFAQNLSDPMYSLGITQSEARQEILWYSRDTHSNHRDKICYQNQHAMQ